MREGIRSVYFRCEFGKKYGLGHLMRCVSLAEGFRKYPHTPTFCLTNSDPRDFKPLFEKSGMEVIVFPDEVHGLDFYLSDFSKNPSGSLTIFDNYDVTGEEMCVFKNRYGNLVAIDDLADRHFSADMIVNQNINAQNLNYTLNDNAKLLLGVEYVLLKNSILKAKRERKRNRVLASFGGGDVFNRIRTILSSFQKINAFLTEELEIDFTVSRKEDLSEYQKVFKDLGKLRFHYIHGSLDISSYMAQADFAVTAAGSTVFELAHLGVPQIAFVIDDNQKPTGSKITEKGFGVCLGDIQEVSSEVFAQTFLEFMRNDKKKEEMTRKGREFIDGKGVERVIDELIACYGFPV